MGYRHLNIPELDTALMSTIGHALSAGAAPAPAFHEALAYVVRAARQFRLDATEIRGVVETALATPHPAGPAPARTPTDIVNNAQRAEWVRPGLDQFAVAIFAGRSFTEMATTSGTTGDAPTVIQDFITNSLHMASTLGMAPEQAIELAQRAKRNYLAELDDEGLDQPIAD